VDGFLGIDFADFVFRVFCEDISADMVESKNISVCGQRLAVLEGISKRAKFTYALSFISVVNAVATLRMCLRWTKWSRQRLRLARPPLLL